MNTEPQLPPFRPILSGEQPLPPTEQEPPNWFLRHKALTFVLALALIVALAVGAYAVVNQVTEAPECELPVSLH